MSLDRYLRPISVQGDYKYRGQTSSHALFTQLLARLFKHKNEFAKKYENSYVIIEYLVMLIPCGRIVPQKERKYE